MSVPNPSASSAILDFTDVEVGTFDDPEHNPLHGVNWSVRNREFWVVAGNPGSGKTELLWTSAGLLKPLKGRVTLFGESTDQINNARQIEQRAQLGMVFEAGTRLLRHLSVAENILLPLCYHHNLKLEEAANELPPILELCGLQKQMAVMPGSLGRWMHPRVALARALILKPRMLLLDSPLLESDVSQQQWWHAMLKKLWNGTPWTNRLEALVVTGLSPQPWHGLANRVAVLSGNSLRSFETWADFSAAPPPSLLPNPIPEP